MTKKKRRNYVPMLLIFVLIAIVAGVVWFYLTGNLGYSNLYSGTGEIITFENLPNYLENSALVKDLPGSANIQLVVDDRNYIIQKEHVEEGSMENPDLIITMDSSYLESLGLNGFCPTVEKALSEGGVSIERKISTTSLAIKYSGMLRYKRCVGI